MSDDVIRELEAAYFSPEAHEREILDALPDLLAGARIFVDVGGSLGQYSYRASRILSGARIIAIEPDPVRVDALSRNCRQWSAESGNEISVVHAAACDEDGEITFFSTQSAVSGRLFAPRRAQSGTSWTPITVAARRLDTILGDLTPDVVKIDVEGVELRVLQGAEQLLRRRRTRFLVEIHGWGDPERRTGRLTVFRWMLGRGYVPAYFHGNFLFACLGRYWVGAFVRGIPAFARHVVRRLVRKHYPGVDPPSRG